MVIYKKRAFFINLGYATETLKCSNLNFWCMTISKKDVEKLRKGYRDELAILEEKCKAGNATKEEYAQLNKFRKKMK